MGKSTQKGTSFESLVLPGFQLLWPDAHRLGKQGTVDRGDIWLPYKVPFVVECKNLARTDLAGGITEAEREAANAGKEYGILCHKRHGKGQWQDQWVTMTLNTFINLVRI